MVKYFKLIMINNIKIIIQWDKHYGAECIHWAGHETPLKYQGLNFECYMRKTFTMVPTCNNQNHTDRVSQ